MLYINLVSNPFSAGRDSSAGARLRCSSPPWPFQTPSARGGIPLILLLALAVLGGGWVSNPFSAGRDSSGRRTTVDLIGTILFQTPSARGGIPLARTSLSVKAPPKSFKPLQRGAGFLCRFTSRLPWAPLVFQTPSARGGIPLSPKAWAISSGPTCFKPLQRGAGFL